MLRFLVVAFAFGGCAPQSADRVAPESSPLDSAGDAAPPASAVNTTWPTVAAVDLRPSAAWPALQTTVPTWRLDIGPTEWAALENAAATGDRDFEVAGKFTAGGQTYNVQTRFHGRSSRDFPKKGFDIKLPKDERFDGRRKLILLAMYQDAGYLTDKLFWDFAAASGIVASRASYVWLELNGRPYGLMLDVERVDAQFLAAHRLDPDGDVFRCGQKDCELRPIEQRLPHQEAWSKETNERTGDGNLRALLDVINRTPEQDFVATLDGILPTGRLVRWLAVAAAISLYTEEDCRSYLVQEKTTAQWTLVPWDLNNSYAMYLRRNSIDHTPIVDRPLFNFTVYDPEAYTRAVERQEPVPSNVLYTRVFDQPELRDQFARELTWVLANRFTSQQMNARIDAIEALVAPLRAKDPWVDQAYAARAAAYLKRYVAGRHEFLEKAVRTLPSHGDTALKLDRVGLDSGGAVQARVVNTSGADLSLDGYFLTGDTRYPAATRLPALTVPAHSTALLDLAALGVAVDLAHPELALLRPDGVTVEDVLYLPALAPGMFFGRSPSGSEGFATFGEP